jgi:hypothetical protein
VQPGEPGYFPGGILPQTAGAASLLVLAISVAGLHVTRRRHGGTLAETTEAETA